MICSCLLHIWLCAGHANSEHLSYVMYCPFRNAALMCLQFKDKYAERTSHGLQVASASSETQTRSRTYIWNPVLQKCLALLIGCVQLSHDNRMSHTKCTTYPSHSLHDQHILHKPKHIPAVRRQCHAVTARPCSSCIRRNGTSTMAAIMDIQPPLNSPDCQHSNLFRGGR